MQYSCLDTDPVETQEWVDALTSLVREAGPERAQFILRQLAASALQQGVALPITTPYVNTIPLEKTPPYPGDRRIEEKISALIRWNAVAMVLHAGKQAAELGGHLASFASAATLYEVGFHHFFRAPNESLGGDMLYIQGHSSPGIYARAFLEGRLTETQVAHFRREVHPPGISSYPHPFLMPTFWQFPTVSMGLGAIQAIYQARFLKYLENRGLQPKSDRKVWTFLGDGEMDEPESLGALTVAAREGCDNLIFVVNCNLQRLDGPVRGNGKIIQELEGVFHGAGWNVIKVVWGSGWDKLLARDKTGILHARMEEVVDGEYQLYHVQGGAYMREHFFGKTPELQALVADMTDDDIAALTRGGHDPAKVYAAYHAAVRHTGRPTVILAKTIKGYGLGIKSGEAQNTTHQQKKMDELAMREFRDRFNIPVSDEAVAEASFYCPPEDSPERVYLNARRKALGGYLPARHVSRESLPIPALSAFDALLKSTGDREISTTMVFVRILNILLKDKAIGKRIVPIVPDETRTFGMEGLFRTIGIYSHEGQRYTPVDADQVMVYREVKDGQLLEEGISEAGGFCSWMAAASAYSTHQLPMIPFFIFYSMFGMQRIGDFAWAAGDLQARGFLLGATAGRTTLAGEGLQHQDGHSHILASVIPNCVCYDPAFSYELAVIIQDGLRRMYQEQESVYYYITVMNENYHHPDMPAGVEEGILKGMYLFKEGPASKLKVQLLGAGAILREVIAAGELLESEYGVSADIWSVTSFNELRKQALIIDRENLRHPEAPPKQSTVTQCLAKRSGPVIAATDYIRLYADQIRAYVPAPYTVLGTDGFGRSDTRAQLRRFFEVDRYMVVVAALKALADSGAIPAKKVTEAMKKYEIDPDKPNPAYVNHHSAVPRT